jgi:hypothetical protein
MNPVKIFLYTTFLSITMPYTFQVINAMRGNMTVPNVEDTYRRAVGSLFTLQDPHKYFTAS